MKPQLGAFLAHVKDLRKHAMRAALWWLLASGICCGFMGPLIDYLQQPYRSLPFHKEGASLATLGVFEVMAVNFKVCFLAGFTLSLPFLLWEVWRFVAPALYPHEKRIAKRLLGSGVILFYIGIVFGYFVIIPSIFSSSLGWASRYAQVMITYENYFQTLIVMLLVFAVVFEVPVILSMLSLGGFVSSSWFQRQRKFVFLASFILGALVSPPDVLSLCLVSLPLYFMVEVSVLIMKKIEKNKKNSQIDSFQ